MSHDDLPALRAPDGVGRRSDEAFARAVVGDVAARRRRFSLVWLAAPALAGAAVVVVALGGPSATPARISAQTWQALAEEELIIDVDVDVDALDDSTLHALVGESDAPAPESFAIPGLEGSSERELLDVEAALDRALRL